MRTHCIDGVFNICELSTEMTTHSNLSFFANRDQQQPTTTVNINNNDDRIEDIDQTTSQHQQEHNFKVNSIIENLQTVCDRATRTGVDNVAMISLLPSSGRVL